MTVNQGQHSALFDLNQSTFRYYVQYKVHFSVGRSNPVLACDCRFSCRNHISKYTQMKKNNHILVFMLIMITLVFVLSISAQTVTLRGRQFSVEGHSKRGESFDSLTVYTYRDSNDSVYTVHLSKNLKAFIVRYSQKTGKPYRKYLQEVTEQLDKMRNDN